eukprot:Phypoly_transcript_05256.p1 GENE.Phypoly_transcript_05256~~Phypoly_transcript_05256.p1  ORF type:complete len:350 (+),score=50.81 Phypoly_transcript_05256:881-1930(+)
MDPLQPYSLAYPMPFPLIYPAPQKTYETQATQTTAEPEQLEPPSQLPEEQPPQPAQPDKQLFVCRHLQCLHKEQKQPGFTTNQKRKRHERNGADYHPCCKADSLCPTGQSIVGAGQTLQFAKPFKCTHKNCTKTFKDLLARRRHEGKLNHNCGEGCQRCDNLNQIRLERKRKAEIPAEPPPAMPQTINHTSLAKGIDNLYKQIQNNPNLPFDYNQIKEIAKENDKVERFIVEIPKDIANGTGEVRMLPLNAFKEEVKKLDPTVNEVDEKNILEFYDNCVGPENRWVSLIQGTRKAACGYSEQALRLQEAVELLQRTFALDLNGCLRILMEYPGVSQWMVDHVSKHSPAE